MDSLTSQYRNVVEKILNDYADFLGSDDQVQVELVFDRERDRYLLVETGWQNGYRIYGTFCTLILLTINSGFSMTAQAHMVYSANSPKRSR